MEYIVLQIPKERFAFLIDNDLLPDYMVKEVFVKDELFKDDPQHKELVKATMKAKEKLKEYEFKKRNNIL